MTANDVRRLLKIDEELLEAEVLLENTIREEILADKHHLLLSRSIRYKVDKLKRMRMNLMKASSDRLSRKQTYSLILAQRKKDEALAEEEVKDIERNIVMLAANQLLNQSRDKHEELKILNSALRRAKLILHNKSRAVDNWLAKSEHDLPVKREYKPRNARIDCKQIPAQNNSADVDFTPKITSMEIVKPNVTAVPFDLLASSPRYDVIDEIPDSAIEPTVEELEERQLKEMHETQYQPPVID